MLKSVSISNVAVIKDMNVELDDGFTVITGETGAGKSVFIDCLSFVLGARADRDMIRTGEDRAEVTAVFDELSSVADRLGEIGYTPDENGELSLSRYLTQDGKSGARINGRSVPVSALKSVSPFLLSIHGQNDSGALSEKSRLLCLLDGYIGIASELEDYGKAYRVLYDKRRELSDLKESLKDRAMMLDILEYQFKEIDSAKLSDPDEEEKLSKLRIKLRSLEKVSKSVSVVNKALIDNEKGITASYLIERAAAAVRQLDDVMDGAEEIASKLDGMKYELTDIAERVSDLISDDDVRDPDKKLDAVETRLALIKKLRGKYGDTVSDILAKKEEIKKRINDLNGGDDAVKDLENEVASATGNAASLAGALSDKRRKAASGLNSLISSVLADLDMPKVKFEIRVDRKTSEGEYQFDEYGFDDVDFFVSANVGEEMQPISKCASGGELSRIMLAVKSTMMSKTGEGSSVFDEIDAGVSGGTSERIGRKLKDLSRSVQIICITHSAQIASQADTHIKISKGEISERVESRAEKLDCDGRINELSRIIGGIKITEKQVRAAAEMLEKAQNK
ncbi:MAG: DNA repair protein RecN [Clostridia bacterium]|nr:DNA repair protein RecN [Clostridia bacterium]